MCDSALKRSLVEAETSAADSMPSKKLCTNSEKDSKVLTDDSDLSKLEDFTSDTVRATENDVGITEFINDYPGFTAVIKERYSDFIVNEIDLQGNIVKLTNMEKPAVPESSIKIADFIDENSAAELQDLCTSDENKEVFIKVTDKDKIERKMIHEAIRKSFSGLESNTCDKDGEKFITVKKIDKKQKGRRFQPPSGGNYTHFVLYKENRDTMDSINTISSFLRIPSKVFSYAGTKDKRAKTSQWVSAYRLSPDKLLSINQKFNMIKVGNFVNKLEQLKLGDLKGNRFIIVLRQLQGDVELVEKSIASLASRGFLNYYGMQRFGTSSVSTHSIGRALLQGEWKSAIDLILKPRIEGDGNMAHSRKIWMETNDAKKAYRNLRNKSSIEGKLFDGLASNNENDLVNALNAIPRNTRLMYIHSYQSYIWNKVLSKRIQKFGLKVLVGDLISKNPNVEDKSDVEIVDNNKKNSSFAVNFVTDENIDNISINDILLPLPGHSITYPKNETKDFYEFFLKEDGMSWGNFESRVKTYSLSGAYRNIITVPSEVHWEILSYDDVCKPLVLSDLDVLQGTAIENSPDGSLNALKLEFKLPSSSYATMAVREISKCSTSFSSRGTH